MTSDLEAVGNVVRCAICAQPGHRLLVGDFSGIESRVLAWIADEPTKLEQWQAFDRSQDKTDHPYSRIAAALGFTEADSYDRGKRADLAFGFQGGLGAYKKFAGDDDTATDLQIEAFKNGWRDRHPNTVQFWWGIDRAAVAAVKRCPDPITYGRLTLQCELRGDAKFLFIMLPSGRRLSYPFTTIITNRFNRDAVSFRDNSIPNGGWTDCNHGLGSYGGLWTENIVQAIARDLLAAAMLRLEAAGYPTIAHIHDEIVVELPDNEGSLDEFKYLIERLPEWAVGLPVAAKVRNGPRWAEIEAPVVHVPGTETTRLSARTRSKPVKAKTTQSTKTAPRPKPPTDDDQRRAALYAIMDRHAAAGQRVTWQAAIAELDGVKPAETPPQPEEAQHPEQTPRDEKPTTAGASGDHPTAAGASANYPHGEDSTGTPETFYIYCDARNRYYLGVQRTSTKQFPQYHWDGTRWQEKLPKGFLKIPYRLPELLDAPPDAWVVIASGEKDADTAARLGFVATTNSGGEGPGQWTPELNKWFSGKQRVAIMEDNDKAGYAHVIEVANALRGVVPDIRIVGFRELKPGGDLTDWFEADPKRDHAALLARIEAAKPAGIDFTDIPLTAEQWLARDLTEQDLLMGHMLSTTVRALLNATTGIGKTNFSMALFGHIGAGKDFLHWHCPRSRHVLYIDGEMSRKLFRDRIGDVVRRLGGPPVGTYFFTRPMSRTSHP
jgi:hypothetical protein